MNENEDNKKVDENWRSQVEKEKKEAQESKTVYHEPTFTIFVSSLAMQAMIALGKLENPITGKTEKNVDQGKFLIDTIAILKEKTKGNLTPDEDKLIDEALYNLRMLYLQDNK